MGLWQFIPSTGRYFNLRQTRFYDGRRDITASTTAAMDYLTPADAGHTRRGGHARRTAPAARATTPGTEPPPRGGPGEQRTAAGGGTGVLAR